MLDCVKAGGNFRFFFKVITRDTYPDRSLSYLQPHISRARRAIFAVLVFDRNTLDLSQISLLVTSHVLEYDAMLLLLNHT